MRNYTWLIALAIVIGARAEAGVDKAGTTAANFLSVGSGAGILGMGGATLGASGDLTMINWNVASLGSLNETQFVISHAGLSGNSSQEWAAVGGRFHHSATRWSLSGLYQGDGAFEGRDATGVSTGTFNVSSMAFGGHLAQAFGDHVTLGFGAKFVTENLGTVSGWGGTYDAGVQVHTGDFGFGLAAQNLGGRMTYGSAIYPMPGNIGAGLAYQIPASGLRFALDANFPSAYYGDVRAGVEWMWKDRLALRTGYRKEMGGASDDVLTGPTFGMGAGMRGMWFDYGYLVGGAAGEGQHRIGLSFHPGALNFNGGEEIGVTPQASIEPPAPKPTVHANEGTSSTTPKSESARSSSATPSSAPASANTTATPKAITPSSAPLKSAPETVTPSATQKAITPVATPSSAPATANTTATPKSITPSSAPLKSAPETGSPSATPRAITPSSAPLKSAPEAVAPSATPRAITPSSAPPKSAPGAVAPSATPRAITPVATPSSAPQKSAPEAVAPAPKTTAPQAPAVATPKIEAPKVEAPKTELPKPSAPITTPAESPKVVTPQPSASAAPAVPLERPPTIKVRKGDTLASIGRTYGLTYAAIMMENNMVTENIKPGQTLKLPKK